jgi:hypothetical protein
VDLHEVSLEGGYSHQPVRVICPKQALDTSAGDCIMLQRTNLEPGHLHCHDAAKFFLGRALNGQKNIH